MNAIEDLKLASISQHEKELTITIPSAVVSNEFKKTFSKVHQVASRPGFRPGKMPASMVLNFFGDKIKKDSIDSLVDKSFFDACKNQELIPVSQPRIEPVGAFDQNAPFIYKAIFQVKPKVEVEKFEKLKIEFTNYSFSESDVDDELKALQESMATFISPESRTQIGAEDLVECITEVSIDGVVMPKYSHKDYSVPLFAQNVPEDLRGALIGKEVESEAMVDYTMPEDHQDEELKGKTCQMKLTIKSFKERKLPALDDEFAKDLSEKFTSMEDVKESIRLRFNITAKRRNEYFRDEAITKALVENNPLEVPPALVEKMAMSLINRELETMKENVAQDLVKNHWNELWESVKTRALFRVKAELILEALISKLEVKVSEEEISERVKKLKNIDRENAKYAIQVEKVLNVIEGTSEKSVKDVPLFQQGEL